MVGICLLDYDNTFDSQLRITNSTVLDACVLVSRMRLRVQKQSQLNYIHYFRLKIIYFFNYGSVLIHY